MSRYVAERAGGAWHVRDADGAIVSQYPPGRLGAEQASAAAARLNKASQPRPGTEIRAWRTARGLSQAKLAKLLGVQWLTVQRWEAGTYTAPPFLHLALKQLEHQLDSQV